VLTVLKGKIDIVPGSRADIFTKKNVSIIEKRLLMKFITQCVEYKNESGGEEEAKEESFDFPDDGKFVDLMRQQKLTDNLIHYILYAMCMGNAETTFKEGLEAIRTYLTSIGRYGNTPYLFPMFGCGEIPQCFCRLCAVFGGVYWLGQKVTDVRVADGSDGKIVKINFGDEELSAKKLVCGLDSNLIDLDQNPHEHVSRAILITSSPVGGSDVNSEMDGGGVVLLYHPVEGKSDGITMIQLAHFTSCISKGLCE
jgi:RAB protein geranylgeranyltransferase component A